MGEKTIKITIDKDKCKGCVLCIKACPQNTLKMSKKVNKRGQQYAEVTLPEKCTGCGICVTMCPDSAIEIIESEKDGD